MKNLFEEPSSKQNRMFQQYIMSAFSFKKFKSMRIEFEPLFVSQMKKRDMQVRRTALACQIEGEMKISQIKLYLKEKDIHIQRAAINVITNEICSSGKKVPKKNLIFMQKAPKAVHRAGVLGYYAKIMAKKMISFERPGNYNFQEQYDIQAFSFSQKLKKEDIPILEFVVSLSPRPPFLFETALIHNKYQNWKKAEEYGLKALEFAEKNQKSLKRAYDINYEKARALIILGLIHYRCKKYQKALYYLEKACKEYPFNYHTQLYLALSCQKLKKEKKAMHYFQKTYLINPALIHASLYKLWSSMEKNLGEQNTYASVFLKRKNFHSYLAKWKLQGYKRGHLLLLLADLYTKNNQIEKAIETFQLIAQTIDLRQSFFQNSYFQKLQNHPWVRGLPK